VRPTQTVAKVIINPRTGSVVMNQTVTIESCAVAHGNLSVIINSEQKVSQPNALAGGQTVTTTQSEIDIKQGGGALIQLKAGVSLCRGGQGDQCAGRRTAGSAVHPAVDESRRRAARRPRNHLKPCRAEQPRKPFMKSTDLAVNRLAIDPALGGDLRARLRADPQAGVRQAARQFEGMLLHLMLKSMRDATPSVGCWTAIRAVFSPPSATSKWRRISLRKRRWVSPH
jgi:hypothetical protein